MRIVVTGRKGQLARSLAERARGWADVDLIRLGRPQLDLEQPKTVAPAILAARPDLVINAAAFTAVDAAEDEPERALRINAVAAGEVAAAARAAGAPVIQVSTDYVFDGTSTVAYREDATTYPLGVYGRSKLEGEQRVRAENPNHAIVRTAWVYSPFGQNFVRTMLRIAANRTEVSVVADQFGNPTSALDLADALLQMASRWNRVSGSQIYHVAGGGEASWADFAVGIFDARARSGMPVPNVMRVGTTDWPTRARRPCRSTLDCTRYHTDFKHHLPSWRTSLPDVVARIELKTNAL